MLAYICCFDTEFVRFIELAWKNTFILRYDCFFASANGVVFAVAWRGPVLPDLNELFGNYFKSFRVESERIRASGRRASTLNVDFEGLLVQSSGRMRDFFGYAFVPTLVPQGVVINDLVR